METIVTYKTKGGKFRKELNLDSDGSYFIRSYKNDSSTGTNQLGLISEDEALNKIEREIKTDTYYDFINSKK